MNKKSLLLVLVPMALATVGMSSCDTEPPHTHTYTKVDAVSATFMKDGCAEHYVCDECEGVFDMDHAATTLDALKIEKLGIGAFESTINAKGSLKVLSIGGSGAKSLLKEVPSLAKKLGLNGIEAAALFKDGAKFADLLTNATEETDTFTLDVYDAEAGNFVASANSSLKSALQLQEWDLVTIQSASYEQNDLTVITKENLNTLKDYILSVARTPVIAYNMDAVPTEAFYKANVGESGYDNFVSASFSAIANATAGEDNEIAAIIPTLAIVESYKATDGEWTVSAGKDEFTGDVGYAVALGLLKTMLPNIDLSVLANDNRLAAKLTKASTVAASCAADYTHIEEAVENDYNQLGMINDANDLEHFAPISVSAKRSGGVLRIRAFNQMGEWEQKMIDFRLDIGLDTAKAIQGVGINNLNAQVWSLRFGHGGTTWIDIAHYNPSSANADKYDLVTPASGDVTIKGYNKASIEIAINLKNVAGLNVSDGLGIAFGEYNAANQMFSAWKCNGDIVELERPAAYYRLSTTNEFYKAPHNYSKTLWHYWFKGQRGSVGLTWSVYAIYLKDSFLITWENREKVWAPSSGYGYRLTLQWYKTSNDSWMNFGIMFPGDGGDSWFMGDVIIYGRIGMFDYEWEIPYTLVDGFVNIHPFFKVTNATDWSEDGVVEEVIPNVYIKKEDIQSKIPLI